jgi:NhaA family Na+:H+ antiporter
MVLGKTLGITIFSWIASSIGIGKLPAGVSWGHVVGISLLGGIGFTVAIFVTELTFGNSEHAELSKVGILVASLISGVLGYLVLRLVSVRSQAKGT